ncbi:MAG: acylneuraminate cytidylyltransferase family protein [Selenomonas ruminantium]|nr:acylneuraminate cytidylyltransferase family protein [Selenomonas ruminantium]
MDNFVAFIPVRGGSKSIPLKNIKEFCGKPLVYWTAKAATDCKYIDEVYISTDSEKIREAVMSLGLPKINVIDRKDETATDTASTESAMLDFAERYSFRHIVLIQATSPLLRSDDLERGCEKYLNYNYDSLLSVVKQKRFIWEVKGGRAVPVNYNLNERPRRQEMDGYLVENGAFYITKRESLLKDKCRLSGKVGVYEMPEETYFEIDEPSDWVIMEQLKDKS